jgi:hypothetical protein
MEQHSERRHTAPAGRFPDFARNGFEGALDRCTANGALISTETITKSSKLNKLNTRQP